MAPQTFAPSKDSCSIQLPVAMSQLQRLQVLVTVATAAARADAHQRGA